MARVSGDNLGRRARITFNSPMQIAMSKPSVDEIDDIVSDTKFDFILG